MTNEYRKNPRVLVIGSTGSIGGPIVRELFDDPGSDGVQVVAAVRNQQKAEAFHARGIETVTLDLSDASSVRAAIAAVDRIFLLTGYTVEMLRQSKIVVDAAVASGVQHIVHLGAMAPADTDLPQFGWHLFVERYIAGSGIGWTHLAPNMFMQNLLGGNSLWDSLGISGERDGSLYSFFW